MDPAGAIGSPLSPPRVDGQVVSDRWLVSCGRWATGEDHGGKELCPSRPVGEVTGGGRVDVFGRVPAAGYDVGAQRL